MPFPTGFRSSRSSKLSRGVKGKSVEEVCVLCFKAMNGDELSSHFVGPSGSKRIFNACCRMLNINELQSSPCLWNFDKENIPFCGECLTNMKILSELFAQLDCIEKSIDKMRVETKMKILLSHEKGKGANIISVKNNKRGCRSLRYNYFRKQAIKEFDPIVNLKRLELPTDKLETIKRWQNTENKNCEPDVHCFSLLLEQAEQMIKIENEVEELEIDYFDDFSTFQDQSKEPESTVENAQTATVKDIYVGNSIVESVKRRKRKTRTKIDAVYDENDDLNTDPEYFDAEDDTRDSSVSEQDNDTKDSSVTEQEYDTKDSSITEQKTDINDSSHLLLIGDIEMHYKGYPYSISKSGYCQCKTCSLYCMNKRRIHDHIREVHLNGTETNKESDEGNTDQTSENMSRSNNPEPNNTHTCPICTKAFKNVHLLRRHTRRGHRERRKVPSVKKIRVPKKQGGKKYLTSLLGDGRFSYRGTTFCTLEKPGCDPKYKCEDCQKIFRGKPNIYQHIILVHYAKRKRECETDEQILAGTDSGVYFRNKSIPLGEGKWSYRNFEYILDTSTKRLRCTKCSKQFDKVYNIQHHIKTVHAQPIRYGPNGKILTKTGTPKVRFAAHAIDLGEGKKSFKGFEYSVIEENKKYQCAICSKFYPTSSSVQQHIKVVHVTNLNLEKYNTMGLERLVGLPAIHMGVGVHSFKGVEFRIEANLVEDVTKYIIHCSVCGKTFPSCAGVRSHIYWLHAPEEDGHKCKVCQKRFYHPGGLQKHEQTHDNQRNHICEQCGLAFKFTTTLTDHIRRVHDKLRPFQCEYCGKQFYTRKDCRVHSVSHTKMKIKD